MWAELSGQAKYTMNPKNLLKIGKITPVVSLALAAALCALSMPAGAEAAEIAAPAPIVRQIQPAHSNNNKRLEETVRTGPSIFAEPYQTPTMHDGAAVIATGFDRFYDSENATLPDVTTTDFTQVFTYTPDKAVALGVSPGSDVSITSTSIDEGLGSMTVTGTSLTGVSAPLPLTYASFRAVGSATQPYDITVTFSSVNSGTITASPPDLIAAYQRGDAKPDGDVDIIDALFIAQWKVGIRGADPLDNGMHAVNAASVKHDTETSDKVDITDAMFIAQYCVGIRNEAYERPLPDTSPPAVSADPVAPVIPETLVEIVAVATDNVDVAEVRLYDTVTGELLQTKTVDGIQTSANVTFTGVESPARRELTKTYQIEAKDAAGNLSSKLDAIVSTTNYTEPAPIPFDINTVLTQISSNYTGNLKTIYDRVRWQITGKNLSEMLTEKTDGGQNYWEITFRNAGGAQSQAERIVENDKIVGTKVYINSTNNKLVQALELLAKEDYGAGHAFVFDFDKPSTTLTSNEWSEGRASLYQKYFMRYMQQNNGLDRSLKNLQNVVDELTALPDNMLTTTNPALIGRRALWATISANATLKAEIEASPTGELSLTSLQGLINFYNAQDPTYTGPAYTQEIADWVKVQLLKRPSPSGRDTAVRPSHQSP